eukprot:757284-Hanusia_phi.AAC.1
MKELPNGIAARACRESKGECTPELIAEAIRSTCLLAKSREQREKSLEGWNEQSKEWFLRMMEEEETRSVDAYTATVGSQTVSFIAMTLMGISSLYVGDEEKLVRKLGEQGLKVDRVGNSTGIMWKAAYRPKLARADEIPIVVSLERNEAAEQLWKGTRTFHLDGKAIRASRVKADHERSIKVRGKRAGGPWQSGRQGTALAELTRLLSLNGMSMGDIAEIYRQQLLRQSVPVLRMEPTAGMLLATAQKGRNGQPQKMYIAVDARDS